MTNTTTSPDTTVALNIGGMTCASCAARITKRLNKLDGVDASVNYATEQATVTLAAGLTVDEVVADGTWAKLQKQYYPSREIPADFVPGSGKGASSAAAASSTTAP